MVTKTDLRNPKGLLRTVKRENAMEDFDDPIDTYNPSHCRADWFLTTLSVVLVCFFLGHCYIQGKRYTFLLAKLNIMKEKLMVLSTEYLESLKNKLGNAYDAIEFLRREVENLQNEKVELEKELNAAVEVGLKMVPMVSQSLSHLQYYQTLKENKEQLQLQANQQEIKTSALENSMISKIKENEKLAQELSSAEQKVLELRSRLKKIEADLIQEKEEHNKNYDDLARLYYRQKKQFEKDLSKEFIETLKALKQCRSLEERIKNKRNTNGLNEYKLQLLQRSIRNTAISNGEPQGVTEGRRRF